ncbi:hypothetical protein DOM22_15295 [Bdellovibrio sp. ZAP7]|uniref:class I SAM-dependent methyltransferase n=1 Tax=Bdellovibrio sp. ZAP7 TaxID=2231053 RepID=UPI0011574F3C|nr:class I SAM-dependent methyltransferase [Bdellovibrio sp. ZAP7]QDK46431.1 hypothetical protein DOM22_15295 [Bdellovibrio sp. ZAP7]
MSNNRYYFDHETAYVQIRKNNHVGWQKKNLEDFRCTETEVMLNPVIAKYFPQTNAKTALDLGCGSGPTAHFFDELGFITSGIDIAPSAIELANEMSAKFNRNISFEVGDVVDLERQEKSYDLIYDSHCMHCIVLEEDRDRTFKAIAKCLKPGGIFMLDTMVHQKGSDFTGGLRYDNDYILWHKTTKGDLAGVTEFEGELWCPQRRIYPAEVILVELKNAGLIMKERFGPNDPYMLRAVCTAVE